MKRYSLGVDWNSAGRPEPCAKEMSAGRFILFADHAVLLRAVAEEVKGMAHGEDCPAVAGCRLCGLHPDEIFHNPRAKTTLGIDAHEFAPGDCECPRGKVLAMLEVEL